MKNYSILHNSLNLSRNDKLFERNAGYIVYSDIAYTYFRIN